MQPEQSRFPAALGESTEADRFCQRGIERLREQDIDGALVDFDRALALESDLFEALLQRGVAWGAKGDLERGLIDISAAIQVRSGCRDAYFLRGGTLLELGRHEEAIVDYSEAIRLQQDDAQSFLYRGRCHDELNEHEEALADFTEAIRLAPGMAEAWLRRGRAWRYEREFDKAVEDLTEALRLNPESAEAYRARGYARYTSGNFQEALEDINEAIRLGPKNAGAFETRGRIWDALDEPTKADADFDQAQQLKEQNQPMSERKSLIHSLLVTHFDPAALDQLTITERRFPLRVRADLQRAVDSLVERMTVHHFSGVRKQHNHYGINFTELVLRDRNDPPLAVPPQYEEIDIGEDEPLRCLKGGFWLLEDDGSRFAVFQEPEPAFNRSGSVRFQVATVNDGAGIQMVQRFFRHLEDAIKEARSYRGKILSLEREESYSGASTGIKVHKLRTVPRDQVILPKRTLELLERNVIHFVRQRSRLAELGLATKKGLLFYGPPGTGKTHTIHYLAGTLEGTTTLLITAEQVGLLGDYMTLARLLQPSMVVIEDADLIARERSSMDSACEEVLLNKLLNEMDGLRESADILFVLTTNRPEAMEAALASRPGRIDQAIEFPFPDEDGRRKLVRLYARGDAIPDDVVEATVRRTEGVSAAFIKELMRRSAQFQLERNGLSGMAMEDVENALEELLFSGGSLNRKLLGGMLNESA